MPKAKEAALKALDLDNNLAEAHVSLGLVKFIYDWDWAGAENEFKRALQLNPKYPSLYHFYSIYLACVGGQFDEAIATAKRGLDLDPLSLPLNNILAGHLYNAGRFDEAIAQRRKMLEMAPNDPNARYQLGRAYAAKGVYDEAFAEQVQAINLWGASKEMIEEHRRVYTTSGWQSYLQWRARIDLESALKRINQGTGTNLEPFLVAREYMLLGENDKSFEWLNKLYEERNGMLVWNKTGRDLDDLRPDPRYAELLRRVGFPP